MFDSENKNAAINIEFKNYDIAGSISGSPNDILIMITKLLNELSKNWGIDYNEIIKLLNLTHKTSALIDFGFNQIKDGKMTTLSAIAFVNSLMDSLFKNNSEE